MFRSLRLMLASLAAAGLLAAGAGAQGRKAPPLPGTTGVHDNARMFSKEAVQKAEAQIKDLVRDFRRGLLIETMKEVPAKYADRAADPKTRRAAFQEMAAASYKREKVGGAYLLISVNPKSIQAEIGNNSRNDGFSSSKRDAWIEAVTAKLKAGDNDGALAAAVEQVAGAFKDIGPAKSVVSQQAPQAARNHAAASSEPLGLTGWIILGVAALVVIWLVVGLLRAFSGMGGGGGGGFMSGLMGGLFGAVAGMWLYNSFFGGSSGWGNAWGSDSGTGSGDEGSTGSGGDYDGGGGGAGGDWGGGGAGGDWGGGDGGGGDW